MDASDIDLLRAYAESGDDACFEQLVKRHISLVFSTALRNLGGDTHMAQDVAQMVFTRLARNPKALLGQKALAGWLYRDAFFAASKLVRTERRRLEREKHAIMPVSQDQTHASDLLPTLDEIISKLRPKERDALVLRFLNGTEVRTAAALLGISEGAFQKRVERAIHKLRAALASKGVAAGSGPICTALLAGGIGAGAPLTFASLIASSAVTSAAAAKSSTILTLTSSLAMSKFKLAVTAMLAAAITAPILVQRIALTNLREENRQLRAENQRSAATHDATAPPQTAIDLTEIDRLRAEHTELMRLRGEVGVRRRQIEELKAQLDQANRTGPKAATEEPHPQGGKYYAAESWANLGYSEPQTALITFFWALRNGNQAGYSGALGKATPDAPPDWVEAFNSVKGSFVSDPEPQPNGDVKMNVAHETTDGEVVNTLLTYRRENGQWLIREMAGFPIVLLEASSGRVGYGIPVQ